MDDTGFTNLAAARVTIVGLGLMGGSLALALAGRCCEIIGVDTDPAPLAAALRRGLIHRAADFDSALADSDFVILATPVRAILAQLAHLRQSPTPPQHRPNAQRCGLPITLLDLGSTKSQILRAMSQLPPHLDPLGGHPMCGKEVSGIENADADLYRGKPFVLCPLDRTSDRALTLARELLSVIGARLLILDAEAHDQIAAVISHLPYTVSVALMRAALANDNEALWQMAASGFRDTTRLAAGDLTMMTDILLTNRSAALAALAGFRTELDSLTAAIESGDPETLRSALESAQRKRREMFK
ncbi:MAG TPA: prephenate dehydrogenase [Anaerolineales bacterium]|nr:prephenate dehydrogenase [Anaerolineales bacterium]